MSINLQSEQFRNNLYNLINSSGLPISSAYFIIRTVASQLELKYNEVINMENQQQLQLKSKEDN